MFFPKIRKSGFTLIEVVVVMLVITLLMGVVAPRFMERGKDAMNNRRGQDLSSVQRALEMYFADNGSYPTSTNWQGDAPNFGGLAYDQSGYIPGLVPQYIDVLPRDPNSSYPETNRGYLYRSNGTDYKVLAFNTPTVFGNDLSVNKYAKFFDPRRPNGSWMVSSPGALNW